MAKLYGQPYSHIALTHKKCFSYIETQHSAEWLPSNQETQSTNRPNRDYHACGFSLSCVDSVSVNTLTTRRGRQKFHTGGLNVKINVGLQAAGLHSLSVFQLNPQYVTQSHIHTLKSLQVDVMCIQIRQVVSIQNKAFTFAGNNAIILSINTFFASHVQHRPADKKKKKKKQLPLATMCHTFGHDFPVHH